MFNVCPNCGWYDANKIIVPEGPHAVCTDCDYRHQFLRLPLFVLTGASGVGKTTACLGLSKRTQEIVALESDILWREEFDQPATNYREYREMWLRVCKNISQAGKPVILCGTALPDQFESCIERRYFSEIYYLALVCDDEVLAENLKNRPSWRRSSTEQRINEQITFNRWLKQNAQHTKPAMSLLDTTKLTVEETVTGVLDWVNSVR
ncbi:MAG TPA: AAA family ATPase [Pyrinomonadaceae bacterium]